MKLVAIAIIAIAAAGCSASSVEIEHDGSQFQTVVDGERTFRCAFLKRGYAGGMWCYEL